LEIVSEYDGPTAVAVKHMNPSGIGSSKTIADAFAKAYAADSTSIFGGIVTCNREIDRDTAQQLSEMFLEIVIAPSFTAEALESLTKKKNIRLLELPMVESVGNTQKISTVRGGILLQDSDTEALSMDQLTYPTKRQPTEQEVNDLLFAWKAVKHV